MSDVVLSSKFSSFLPDHCNDPPKVEGRGKLVTDKRVFPNGTVVKVVCDAGHRPVSGAAATECINMKFTIGTLKCEEGWSEFGVESFGCSL